MAIAHATTDRSPPLKLDQKTLTLWEELRAGVEAEEDWLAL